MNQAKPGGVKAVSDSRLKAQATADEPIHCVCGARARERTAQGAAKAVGEDRRLRRAPVRPG